MHRVSPGDRITERQTLQTQQKKTVLSNGLRIVTEEIPYVRSVAFGVWIDVGSRDEDVNNNGISHFVEHMVFKGTKHYTIKGIAQSLESVGGYLNAFTGKEHTCFYARVLDSHLSRAVNVIADLINFPEFPAKELEKEKLVVLEELKHVEDDPDDLIHDYFDHTIYRKHPLGFSVIGREKNIQRFKRGELYEFMSSYYVPQRMAVVAVGNLHHDEVVSLVEKKFSAHSGRKRVRQRLRGPKSHRARRQVFEKSISQAHICMGTIAGSVRSPQRYASMLMSTLLGEGMSSRLFQNLREKYGLAYNVYSFVNTMSDTGNFGVYVGTDEANIDRSIELIYKEFGKLKSSGVRPSELRRTASQVKGTMMLSLESLSSRMMRLGTGEMYYGESIPLNDVIQKIDNITSEDIYGVARSTLNTKNFSTVIFKPRANSSTSASSVEISPSIP